MRLFNIAILALASPFFFALACMCNPTPAVVDSGNAWKTTIFGCTIVPLLVNEIHGPVKTNIATLIIPPGAGFPPHRHPGVEEHMYILSGSGEITAWLPNATEKATHHIQSGGFHYLPPGGIHRLWNNGVEDLKVLISQTPGPLSLEMFEDWPNRLDVPVKNVVRFTDFIDVIAKEKMLLSCEASNGSCVKATATAASSRGSIGNFMARYWQQWSGNSF